MGWRKRMGVLEETISSQPYLQKVQNVQKNMKKNTFAYKNQNQKIHQGQFDSLWEKAWKLADWIDDPNSDVPWQKRAEKVPKLQKMSIMLDELKMRMLREKF